MKGVFLFFFLLLTLMGSALAFPTLDSFILTPNEEQFLQTVRGQALFLNKGNAILLKALRECHQYFLEDEKGYRPKVPQYVQRVKSLTGEDLEDAYSCQELFSRYFGYGNEEAFRKNFRLMQYHAILAQSGKTRNWVDAETLDGNYQDKLSGHEHPVKARGSGVIPLEKPDAVVWKKAFETYQTSIQDFCQEFIKTKRVEMGKLINEHPSSPFYNNLCHYLPYKMMKGPGSPPLKFQDQEKVLKIWKLYINYSRANRYKFNDEHRAAYNAIIGSNPHYLLLPSRRLTLPMIKSVILKLQENQDKSNTEIVSLSGRKLLRVLPFYDSFPMTINAILKNKGWSEKKITSITSSLRKKYDTRDTVKTVAEMTLSIGSVAACLAIPAPARALGIVTIGLARGACYLTFGTGWEIYFLMDAIHARSKAFRQLAVGPETEFLFHNVDKLDSGNQEVLMAVLFLPLGLQPKVTSSVIKNVVRSLRH